MKKIFVTSVVLLTVLLLLSGCAPAETTTPPPAKPTTTPTAKPAAPTNLAASVKSGGIVLTWTDNSDNEEGFRIDRSTDSGFKQGTVTLVAFGVLEKSYTDNSAATGTTYYYRVVAHNALGTSDPSNIVTISK